jgi:YVTN family beta-propeller protein
MTDTRRLATAGIAAIALSLIAGAGVMTAGPAQSFTSVEVTVAVGAAPEASALSPSGHQLYVVNGSSGTLSVVDTSTFTVTSTITGLGEPSDVATLSTTDTVYVTSRFPAELLAVLPASMATSRLALPGTSPAQLAISPSGNTIYVTDSGGALLQLTAVAPIPSSRLTSTLAVGGNPGPLAVSPDGAFVYVVNRQGSLIRVNAATFAVESETPLGLNLTGIALHTDTAYVSSATGEIYAVNLTTGSVVTHSLGGSFRDIAIAWDGSYAYLPNSLSASLDVIALPSGTWTQSIPLTNAPFGVTVADPGISRVAYTVNRDSNTVSRLTLRPGKAGAPTGWRTKKCSVSGRTTTARLAWQAPGAAGDFALEGYSYRWRKPSGRWSAWSYTIGVERRGVLTGRGLRVGDRLDLQVASLTRAGRGASLRGECTVSR